MLVTKRGLGSAPSWTFSSWAWTCGASTKKAEPCRSRELTGWPDSLNLWVPGQQEILAQKPKVDGTRDEVIPYTVWPPCTHTRAHTQHESLNDNLLYFNPYTIFLFNLANNDIKSFVTALQGRPKPFINFILTSMNEWQRNWGRGGDDLDRDFSVHFIWNYLTRNETKQVSIYLAISFTTQLAKVKLRKFPYWAAEKQKPLLNNLCARILLQWGERLGQRTKCFTFLSQRIRWVQSPHDTGICLGIWKKVYNQDTNKSDHKCLQEPHPLSAPKGYMCCPKVYEQRLDCQPSLWHTNDQHFPGESTHSKMLLKSIT